MACVVIVEAVLHVSCRVAGSIVAYGTGLQMVNDEVRGRVVLMAAMMLTERVMMRDSRRLHLIDQSKSVKIDPCGMVEYLPIPLMTSGAPHILLRDTHHLPLTCTAATTTTTASMITNIEGGIEVVPAEQKG